MDHRQFMNSLSAEQRRMLTRKSDFKGLAALAAHWGAILVVGGLIAMRVPGWPLLIVVQGILVIFLFTLLHETCHQTAFKTPRLNDLVGYVCGFAIALPANWFRYFHLAHHRHSQDPDKDPELADGKPETLRQYLILVSGLPVWRSHARTLTRNAAGNCDDDFVPRGKLRLVRDEARAMIAAYLLVAVACIALGSSELLYVWVLPALAGQPFLRLYLLAEHGRCPYVTDMFENTRTTFTSWIVRKVAWNMPFHTEHHAYPTVPFHLLPRLHELTRPHLKETENGYSRFHRKYAADLKR